MKLKHILPILIFNLFSIQLIADTCTWTGATDNNWNNPNNWSCNLVPGTNDEVIIDDASVSLNESITIASLSLLPASTISGTGTININGSFDVASGNVCTIEVDINSYGLATIGLIDFTIKNATVQFFGGGSIAHDAELQLNDSGVFKIPTGATFTVLGKLNVFGIVEIPTFVVEGTLNKSGTGVMDFEAYYLFENATVNIMGGSIVNFLANGMVAKSLNATINISENARLEFARSAQIKNTAISGAGKIKVGGFATPSFNTGTTITGVEIEINGGILFLENDMTVPSVFQKGGQFSGNNITILGDYRWQGGYPAGTKTIEGSTIITDITSAVETRDYSGGTLNMLGGGTCETNDVILGNLTVPETTTFTVNVDEDCTIGEIKILGTLVKTGAATLTLNSFFQFNTNGIVKGEGRIKGSFMVNRGIFQPGISTGTMTIEATDKIILESDSNLEIELEEMNGILSTDLLEIIGNVDLDGSLTVSEMGVLPDGEYAILTATGTITDTFTNLQLPANYSVIYNANDVTLKKLTPLVDADGDGFFSDVDCDDTDPDINPDAIEIANNDIDEDCDGMDLLVAVQEIDNSIAQIFPNPFKDNLFVQLEKLDQYKYKLLDLHGKLIQTGNLNSISSELQLSNISNGIYILSIQNNQRVMNYRIAKNSP